MTDLRDIQRFPKDNDLFYSRAINDFILSNIEKELVIENLKKAGYIFLENEDIINNDELKYIKSDRSIHYGLKDNIRILLKKFFPSKEKYEIKKIFGRRRLYKHTYKDKMTRFYDYLFEELSTIPQSKLIDQTAHQYSYLHINCANLLNVISNKQVLESKSILLLKDEHKIQIGDKTIPDAKIKFIYPAKLIAQMVALLSFSKVNSKQITEVDFRYSLNDPFKYLPIILSMGILEISDLIIANGHHCEKNCYFLNYEPELTFSNLDGRKIRDKATKNYILHLVKNSQIIREDIHFSENALSTKISDFNKSTSYEVKCDLNYDPQNNILTIEFDDNIVIDYWAGADSLFLSYSNYCAFISSIFNIPSLNSFFTWTNFSKNKVINEFDEYKDISEYCSYLEDKYKYNKEVINFINPCLKFLTKDPELDDLSYFYKLNKKGISQLKYIPSCDFTYSQQKSFVYKYEVLLKKEINKQTTKKRKKKSSLTDSEILSLYQVNERTTYSTNSSFYFNNRYYSYSFFFRLFIKAFDSKNNSFLSVITKSVIEYSEIIDLIFNLTRDIELFEYISNSNSRDTFFTILDTVVSLITFDTKNVYYGVLLSEYINSFKRNIIYLDKLSIEQKQREQEAKLLVRNLRHSINNTSEAVLANLKDAIEITNQQNGNKKSGTVNHLYSCSDEVRVLRNTVLKFCHEIIDTDTLGELYRESFAEVKADEGISLKEILYSSLFMSVKQIIQNIRLKELKANYRKVKTVELPYNDNLFNKFKDYIGIKYDQNFSELTESEMKEDITLYKDYQNYIYTATQSADFDKLYEAFVQKNNMKAVISFMERYFFSRIEIIWDMEDVYLRQASYASYLFTDLLNEICLNAIKYTLPDSKIQIRFEVANSHIKAEFKNNANPDLKQKYGSGMGIIGQQKVVEKVGGSLQSTEKDSGVFSLKFELPIY